jgi:hypothetical protein
MATMRRVLAAICLSFGSAVTLEEACISESGESCDFAAHASNFSDNSIFIQTSYGVVQHHAKGLERKTSRLALEVEKYMQSQDKSCTMDNKLCLAWSANGECEKNQAYMRLHCAPACFACHCKFDPNSPVVWQPGDLEKFYRRISSDKSQKLTIVASPDVSNLEIGTDSPWIVILDDFLTRKECDMLIKLGEKQGFVPSSYHDNSNVTVHGGSHRTGSTAWCTDDKCRLSMKSILKKVEKLTKIPQENYELQLVRYQEGEFYKRHHDYLPEQAQKFEGPRLVTIFFYLNVRIAFICLCAEGGIMMTDSCYSFPRM